MNNVKFLWVNNLLLSSYGPWSVPHTPDSGSELKKKEGRVSYLEGQKCVLGPQLDFTPGLSCLLYSCPCSSWSSDLHFQMASLPKPLKEVHSWYLDTAIPQQLPTAFSE